MRKNQSCRCRLAWAQHNERCPWQQLFPWISALLARLHTQVLLVGKQIAPLQLEFTPKKKVRKKSEKRQQKVKNVKVRSVGY
jgi:hypothetical protein